MTVYLKTETFNALADSIAGLEPCPFAGKVTAGQVKLLLVAIGGVAPDCIREPTPAIGLASD